ncbi:mandelate racemase/muconate lactonizing enzyme family protein [Arthrobacter sp. ES3-54]|jgi:L-alanine-DL-glutamate epimerase-like enolase superfamily enzyme|uniref:L-talarate/galactarate dehydratase n=1 Tax=Arthrobacter sp. ES3-54 TaxID=1502991 RepID=UPI0024064787|nr:mandelate racemase/muconate lactonizing enzyme family protein [Arthrobacter sp. ES3-54]MDF9750519.1 L-alanine-DL-glutamate epimerase-like enolase superfamily enzyme [Arthrobacter sp. ES3-54]
MVNDRITAVKVSLVILPLQKPASDAKVLTGKQKPLAEVAFLFAEITSEEGHEGVGYSYALRAGAPALYAHARELAPELIGENPNDIQRIWSKLAWLGQSVGRSGVTAQALAAFDVALWDLKAKRARLPLAQLLGAHRDSVPCYNTSGGYLSTPIDELVANAQASLAAGIGGIKIKVGQPDRRLDLSRVAAVRSALGEDVPLMVDANQQWNRTTAIRMGLALEEHGLTWIEEPLDAYDADGHAELARQLATPIATGEMLTSTSDHYELIRRAAVDFIQPDAPRVGGITPFLRIMALGEQAKMAMAPHFAMEIHIHLSAAYELDAWVEHFDWLEPLFDERLEIRAGHMHVPSRPGLGFSISEQARAWTVTADTFTDTRLLTPHHSNA